MGDAGRAPFAVGHDLGRAREAADFADTSHVASVPLDTEFERLVGVIAFGIYGKFWRRHNVLLV